MAKYRDWLKAEQTNINPVGTPVIVRPSETVGAGYAALTMRNEQIRNTPETARGGYSALAPVDTVSASVPKLASDTPDWAKRTATEQQRAQLTATPAVGYASLVPNASPYNGSMPTYGNAPTSGYATLSDEYIQRATTEAVPKTDAGSPSTGETGYAALDPEYAKRVAQIENEYARSTPNYGVQAERMAQAGIHGGYSDYLQGVAYAQMQSAKENAYADYLSKQQAQATTDAQEGNARTTALYTMLADPSYLDDDGNEVRGYGLAYESRDNEYEKAKESLTLELKHQGYSQDEISEVFARVDKQRDTNIAQIRADAEQAVKSATDGATTVADLYAKLGYTPSESDTEGSAFLNALNQGVENGLISPASRSSALKENLSIYSSNDSGKAFADRSWKQKGDDLYQSVKNAIDYGNEGLMDKGDVDTVIKDATAKLGFDSIMYKYNDGSKALNITLSNGNTLRADYDGAASADATNYLNANYRNLPLAIYNGQLYYQTTQTGKEIAGETRWYKLKTKKGSPGTPNEGDNYFKTIALIMMQNKDKYHLGLPEVESTAKWWGEGVQYADERKKLKQIVYNIASGKVSYRDIEGNTLNSKAFE